MVFNDAQFHNFTIDILKKQNQQCTNFTIDHLNNAINNAMQVRTPQQQQHKQMHFTQFAQITTVNAKQNNENKHMNNLNAEQLMNSHSATLQ